MESSLSISRMNILFLVYVYNTSMKPKSRYKWINVSIGGYLNLNKCWVPMCFSLKTAQQMMNNWKIILDFSHIAQGTLKIFYSLHIAALLKTPSIFLFHWSLSLCILKSQVVFFTALLSNSYAISVKASVFDFFLLLFSSQFSSSAFCYHSHTIIKKKKRLLLGSG